MNTFSYRMVPSMVLTYAAALAPFELHAQQRAKLPEDSCSLVSRFVPRISSDSIGKVALNEPLSQLQNACAARDTVVRQEGSPSVYPGLVIHLDSLTIIGLQYADSLLNLDRPADGWLVFGTRATILDRAPLSAPWSVLRGTFGTVQATGTKALVVRFCAFPNALMTLDTDPTAVTTASGQVDLSRIPLGARVHHLFILNRELGRHLHGC